MLSELQGKFIELPNNDGYYVDRLGYLYKWNKTVEMLKLCITRASRGCNGKGKDTFRIAKKGEKIRYIHRDELKALWVGVKDE